MNGAYESIARIRLVQGELDEASRYLDLLEESIRTPADRVLYANRYAQLTRAIVLARQGRLADALHRAESAAQLAQRTSDQLLLACAQIAQAEILPRVNRLPDAMALLSGLVTHLATLPPDVYAQYERALALALVSAGDVPEGQVHLDRARRTFEGLHNAPGQLDAQRVWDDATAAHTTASPAVGDDASPAATVAHPAHLLQDLAALLLHAGRPELMARDLVMILTATHQIASVVAQMRMADGSVHVMAEAHPGPLRSGASRRFALGEARGSTVEVLITPRAGISAHATLNAVALVLGTIHELERSRAEREERLTLWPIEEIPGDDDRAVVTGRMRELMSTAQKVARTNASVLITGESGTGKEILARAIHESSSRADKPFVPFNCAAIPRDMLESQLFGHRRGAFTGADRDHPGVIRSAREGTLFLDEIGEMGLDLQPKLLRFLESGEIAPLGETSPPTVDVRIIAATNAHLEQLVQDGRFREDLFYRLNVIRLTVPPLRERRDEIPALVHHFLARAATEFMKGRLRVSDEAMEHIVLYRWPGNIRQLQNEVRRIVALAEPDITITPGALSHEIRRAGPRPVTRAGAANELSVPLGDKLAPTISRIEREMIQTALTANQGRLEAAARALGISRKGLYLKRQRFGL